MFCGEGYQKLRGAFEVADMQVEEFQLITPLDGTVLHSPFAVH